MPLERRVQSGAGACGILAGGADIEQAHLIGEQDGQGAHQQRRGLDQRVAEVFHLGIRPVIGQEVLDDRHDGLARAGGIDEQQHDVADQQAQHDAQQRRQQGLDAVILEDVFLHAFTSSLLAPAM